MKLKLLSWVEEIPESNKEDWITVMSEALVEGTLEFTRSTRPASAVGIGPLIVGFGDGGVQGFGGDVYLQWQV